MDDDDDDDNDDAARGWADLCPYLPTRGDPRPIQDGLHAQKGLGGGLGSLTDVLR